MMLYLPESTRKQSERRRRQQSRWSTDEKLVEEEGIQVPYSTLTRLLRELGLEAWTYDTPGQ